MTVQTIEGAVISLLTENQNLTGFIADRIYPGVLPDKCSFPAISYLKVSNPKNRLTGSPRIQFSIWSKNYLECQLIAQALESGLDGFAGNIEGFDIVHIIPLDAPDEPLEETGLFHIPFDFLVIYQK